MTIKLEYIVVDEISSTDGFANREEARNFKRHLKEMGIQSKIIQNVWTLAKQKSVR